METGLLIFGMLVAGLAFGSAARFLIPGPQRFTLAETTLIGIAGAGVGSVLVSLIADAQSIGDLGLASILGGVGGSIIVLGIAEFVANKFRLRSDLLEPDISLTELLRTGESSTVEFKSTARWNLHTRERDDRIELAIARTVAGFLNADGGTLIIGVDDNGKPIGLSHDLSLMKEPDLDRYELWINDFLEVTLGKPALTFLSTRFVPVGDEQVVVIKVEPAAQPIFVNEPKGQRTADFYVRMGNSTRKLQTDEFATYRQSRWK